MEHKISFSRFQYSFRSTLIKTYSFYSDLLRSITFAHNQIFSPRKSSEPWRIFQRTVTRQLSAQENRGERNWFGRHRATKGEGGLQGAEGEKGDSLVRRNANSDNEGAKRGWRGRSFARPSRKFRRPLRFRCRRPYNRRVLRIPTTR